MILFVDELLLSILIILFRSVSMAMVWLWLWYGGVKWNACLVAWPRAATSSLTKIKYGVAFR